MNVLITASRKYLLHQLCNFDFHNKKLCGYCFNSITGYYSNLIFSELKSKCVSKFVFSNSSRHYLHNQFMKEAHVKLTYDMVHQCKHTINCLLYWLLHKVEFMGTGHLCQG